MRHDPARLLHAAAATLAAGVVSDSTVEHYRAGFHNRAMFVAPIVSSLALASALSSTLAPTGRAARTTVSVVSMITGLAGFGFHLANVSRRPGGWSSANVFHGAPLAAPLAITMAGFLGLAASRINGRRRPGASLVRAIGGVSALGLLGTSAEAAALHFRGAFQNFFMYAPVAIPPIAAVALGTTMMARSSCGRPAARALLRLTGWLGVVGVGFHAWGVHRRMGGWRNWRQNLLVGPPLPAPPAFAGLALAGLVAVEMLDAGGDR
jgi:hypothetical protein